MQNNPLRFYSKLKSLSYCFNTNNNLNESCCYTFLNEINCKHSFSPLSKTKQTKNNSKILSLNSIQSQKYSTLLAFKSKNESFKNKISEACLCNVSKSSHQISTLKTEFQERKSLSFIQRRYRSTISNNYKTKIEQNFDSTIKIQNDTDNKTKFFAESLPGDSNYCSRQCIQVPENTFYKRPLPSHLVAFSSDKGKELFKRALEHGYLASFYKLMEQYHTQNDVAFCGLTSLCMILNALNVDPGKKWKHPWRWWAEELLECCIPMEIIRKNGITVQQFYCIASCNGLTIEYWNGGTTDLDTFRSHIQLVTSEERRKTTGEEVYMVCSFSRKTFQQTGSGHFAPVAAFSPWTNGNTLNLNNNENSIIMEEDKVLLLDTAKFKYPSFFVSLNELHESMQAHDTVTNAPRGYFIIRRNINHESVFLQLFQSCQTNHSFRRFIITLIERSAKARESLYCQAFNSLDPQSSAFSRAFHNFIQYFLDIVQDNPILSHHFEKYTQMLHTEICSCETHQSSLNLLLSEIQTYPIFIHVKKVFTERPLEAKPFENIIDNDLFLVVLTIHITSLLPGSLYTNLSEMGTNDQFLQNELGVIRRYMQGHLEDYKNNRFAFEKLQSTQDESNTKSCLNSECCGKKIES